MGMRMGFLTVPKKSEGIHTIPPSAPLTIIRCKDQLLSFLSHSISRLFPTLGGREVGREQSGMTYFSFFFPPGLSLGAKVLLMVSLGFHEHSKSNNYYHLLNIGTVLSTLCTLFYSIYTNL